MERLAYQARLAEKQFSQADPDNRLVTAELERRWEVALQELREAQDSMDRKSSSEADRLAISPELRQLLEGVGTRLPELWNQDLLTMVQKKALLRCLIDKVVLQRSAPDTVGVRIVWKGGDTTRLDVPVTVNALSRLSFAKEMEAAVVKLARDGKADIEIARELTRRGYRSPQRQTVLAKHGEASASPTRRVRQAEPVVPSPNCRLPDGASNRHEAEGSTTLGARPHPQRDNTSRERRRAQGLLVPRQPENPGPVQATSGRPRPAIAFLKGIPR